MSRLQSLKLFVRQRLAAAVDDIFGQVERTITEYEEELDRRHRDLLPGPGPRTADLQELDPDQVPPEQQDWRSCLKWQDPPEPPHIKEEQEEVWRCREGGRLGGLEEVREEEEEDEARSLQTHKSQTEPPSSSSYRAHRDQFGGPEASRNSDPHRCFQPVCDDETRVSDEVRKNEEPQSGSPSVPENERSAAKKSFTCCECGRKFGRKDSLRRHMRFHTGEKPYGCSVCSKRFSQRPNLIRHLRCHSGEKPFSCSYCDTSFAVRSALVNHMRIHTGEKPFSCLCCDKRFTQKGGLKKHMSVHTGEKPYSCPACNKRFSQKANLTYHFSVHTGQKHFSCRVCGKRFTWQSQVKSHKCVGGSGGN